MRYLKYLILILGVVGTIVALAEELYAIGTHGYIVLATCLIPVLLAGLGATVIKGFPRWAAAVTLLSFLVAGIKTSEVDSLAGIMMSAFVGMLLSLVLLVKPDRPAARPA
jgi:hypothetical protein